LGFKIASEIALSTTESEYIALSMATRELLLLRWLVQELHKHSFISTPLDQVISHTMTNSLKATQIFEDNASYATFAGLWHRDFAELRDCSLCCTGYVITYCGCPIHWASKLQSEITLSTTKSEYIALSMATRELLLLRWLVQELHKHSFISTPLDPVFSHSMTNSLKATQIFEDNASYADFAGLWHRDFDELRDCSLSCTGYVITYCGCPIHWASKLQSEIALSTTESKYIALSMATRELLPLRWLVQELHKHSFISTPLDPVFSHTMTNSLKATNFF
jgi:beta-xylosidase